MSWSKDVLREAARIETENFREEYALLQEELALEEHLAKERARRGLLNFVIYMMPKFQVNWHHRIMCRALNMIIDMVIKRAMFFAPPRNGKALAMETPIATPKGWSTIGELRVGDAVFDENGITCRVIAKSPVFEARKVWRVSTNDGASVIADGEHLWSVRLCRKHRATTLRTTSYLAARTSARRPLVKVQGALRLPEVDLPIDPYALGLWLGDGCSGHATITAQDADAVFYREELRRRGVQTVDRGTPSTFGIVKGFWRALIDCNLVRNKHIPPIYLRAGVEQRWDLLRGLIDTDGHVAATGQVEFTTIKRALAEQVLELVLSLGIKASIIEGVATLNKRIIGPKYRVMFYAEGCALLPRKRVLTRDAGRTRDRYISFEAAGHADTQCIQVDSPSGMYLAGTGLIPTHNSEIVSRNFPAMTLGRDPDRKFICASHTMKLAKRLNRDVQNIMLSAKYKSLFPDTHLVEKGMPKWLRNEAGVNVRNSERFDVIGRGGQMLVAGVDGGITGEGADILSIDDPCKDAKQARSQTWRNSAWEWWTSTALTRLSVEGAWLFTMTRWHQDDPGGRLLKQLQAEADAKDVLILSLPAIKVGPPTEWDPRKEGEPLHAARFPLAWLEKKKVSVGPKVFGSLYQQDPSPAEGNVVLRSDWRFYKVLPKSIVCDEHYLFADLNLKPKKTSDYTVLQIWGRKGARFYLLDQVRAQMGFLDKIVALTNLAVKWPEAIGKYIEDSTDCQPLIETLEGKIAGLIPVSTGGVPKEVRIEAIAPLIRAHNVILPHPTVPGCEWVGEYIEEWAHFPDGAHDDQCDATALGLREIAVDILPNDLRLPDMQKDNFLDALDLPV